MVQKIKEIINKMNEKGIPIPMVRDPKTQKPSVSLTLVVISGNIVLISLLNSFANVFKGVDTESAIYWFIVCFGGYLGRKFQTNGKDLTIEEKTYEVPKTKRTTKL
jgi:hypothetical protein